MAENPPVTTNRHICVVRLRFGCIGGSVTRAAYSGGLLGGDHPLMEDDLEKRYGAGSPKLIRGHWEVIAIAVLMALGASLTKLERTIPALRPAPGWMGPLFLAPFTAVAIYFVVRF